MFNDILSQTLAMLQQHGRISYWALKRQFALDDAYLADLTEALLFAHPQVVDEEGRGLVWTDIAGSTSGHRSPIPKHTARGPGAARERAGRPTRCLSFP